MALQSVTLDIPTIMTLAGHPTPMVSENAEGQLVITYVCASNDAAIKTAKAASRELVKFRQEKDVKGHREQGTITFTFGTDGAELPLTWRGRKNREGKPEELAEIQKALEGYKTTYFNSSVNEGIVVADDRVPCGLQFVYDKESGDLVAKVLKSAQVGGGKTWTDRPLDSSEQALELVQRLEGLFVGL